MSDSPTGPTGPAAGPPAGSAPEDPVHAAVLGCDGVADLRAVHADDDLLRLTVAARHGTSLTALGDRVADALGGLLAGRRLQLGVVDVLA